jgi:peptide/nickel transport system substrate-binding protein
MPNFPTRLLAVACGLLLTAACSPPPQDDAPAQVISHNAPTPGSTEPHGTTAQKKQTGDWLVNHLVSDPEQLNPLTSNDATASSVLGHIFESLLIRDPENLNLKPLLASKLPEISDDKLSYTFTLRDGAHFSDGQPVTAEDVLFSIKAIKCETVNAPFTRVYYASITDAQLVGPNTVRFTASKKYFKNQEVLGGISILPKHYYDPTGHLDNVTVQQLDAADPAVADKSKAFGDHFNRAFSRNPMGSGPYLFKEWSTGERVILDRDDHYWGNKHDDVERPYIDRLMMKIVNNTAAALVTLKGGELDTMSLDPLQALRETNSKRFTENFEKLTYYSPGYTYIGWNNDHKIFSDTKVRRAMTMLADRQAMVDTILHGMGTKVDSPIYRFRPEYDEHLVPPPFDPKAAVALLNEAGWADHNGDGILDKMIDGESVPFVFELKINSGNEPRKSVALTMQDQLKRHGIRVKIRELDWTIFLDAIRKHNFDAMILGWSMSVNPPDGYQIWHSSQIANKGSNHISFRNDRVDDILEAYRQEFDADKRSAMYQEFQQILNREQPYTFLFMRQATTAYQRRFHDVKALPIGGPVTDHWWVPSAQQRYGTTLKP